MKKIILSIVYPIWFFFAKTWLGGLVMIPIVIMPVPTVVSVVCPESIPTSKEAAEGLGYIVTLVAFICAIPVAGLLMDLSDRMEDEYKKLNYRTRTSF